MKGDDARPSISPWLAAWFRWYARRYLRKHFHTVRLAKADRPHVEDDLPLIVFLNHAAWWDPLVALVAAARCFPRRDVFAPIEAVALERYRFMARLGLFPVDANTISGRRAFLETTGAILRRPRASLWITPQGRFADPRERPVRLRPGLAHLARRLGRGIAVPMAIEYPFWEERGAEVLVRLGEPIDLAAAGARSAKAWGGLLERQLASTQDALAEQAIGRNPDDFEVLLRGRTGVGGVYDLWRRAKAWTQGRPFQPEHGDK